MLEARSFVTISALDYRRVIRVLVCTGSFLLQAEDGIRYLVRSRGRGDVYKRQPVRKPACLRGSSGRSMRALNRARRSAMHTAKASAANQPKRGTSFSCLLYTSDAADERSRVDLGGRRNITKKKKKKKNKVWTVDE